MEERGAGRRKVQMKVMLRVEEIRHWIEILALAVEDDCCWKISEMLLGRDSTLS